MKNFLLILLIILALVMIALSFKMEILAPGLTGVGFIIISLLFFSNK